MLPKSPAAFEFQKAHCTAPSDPKTQNRAHQASLVGTCLLIGPNQPHETDPSNDLPPLTESEKQKRYWIACLFTSHGFGRDVGSRESILDATASAVDDLHKQIEQIREKRNKLVAELAILKDQKPDADSADGLKIRGLENDLSGLDIGDCYSVRINSGLFGVPWEDTKAVLEKGKLDMVIVRPPEEQKKPAITKASGQKRQARIESFAAGWEGPKLKRWYPD
ncbi:MAG: hypothetical protein Q9174_005569 [Haloplaca sp. 1 TL-2023]